MEKYDIQITRVSDGAKTEMKSVSVKYLLLWIKSLANKLNIDFETGKAVKGKRIKEQGLKDF